MQVLKDEIRNKILAAAEDMFYEKGFKETTTRSIAAEVGISVSNLYLYYENKEATFYAVTDGFYSYFIKGAKKFMNHKDAENNKIDEELSNLIMKIIITDQKKFVIIADKSQGTKYEDFKMQLVKIVQNHMKEQVNKELVQDDLITYILAKNLIEGIIEIAKNYKDKVWLENSIKTLVCYHMNGMKNLM